MDFCKNKTFVPQIERKCIASAPVDRLTGKVIAITGASSGIGKSIAEKAVAEGAKVIIIARREDRLNELSAQLYGNCRPFVYDVREYDGKDALFEVLEQLFSMPVCALVNNAGIYLERELGEYTVDDFDSIISTNLKAPFFLMQGYVNYCKRKGIKGNIVVTASNRGLFGDTGPYGISKAGIINLVQGFARETVLDGIRINAVAPGMTASEINGIDIAGDLYTSSARGKRVLLPVEIAEIVCFLLSDYSKCITGSIIPCDEGDYLR